MAGSKQDYELLLKVTPQIKFTMLAQSLFIIIIIMFLKG